jgi:hypothetical protein
MQTFFNFETEKMVKYEIVLWLRNNPQKVYDHFTFRFPASKISRREMKEILVENRYKKHMNQCKKCIYFDTHPQNIAESHAIFPILIRSQCGVKNSYDQYCPVMFKKLLITKKIQTEWKLTDIFNTSDYMKQCKTLNNN